MSKELNSKLREVVAEIVVEIKGIRQGEYGVYYSDIINYILGHGDLAFNLKDEKGLRSGEIIGELSEKELGKIIQWCFQKVGSGETVSI